MPKATSSRFESSHSGSMRKSKTAPFYSNASGAPPNLGLLDRDADGSDEGLPSPSELLRIRNLHDYSEMERGDTIPTIPKDRTGIEGNSHLTLQASESFTNATFEFNAFETPPQLQPSSDNKRAVPSGCVEQQPKRLRLDAEEKGFPDSNVEDPGPGKPESQLVPDWAEEFEPDLVAYFFGPDLW
jgi:hypothetical protein